MGWSMGWSMDQVHSVVHGPRSMFCIRPLVWCCLIVFDRVWLCLIRPSNIRSETKIIPFVLVFDGRCFVRLDSRVSSMFDTGMRTTLAQRLVSIVWSMFDQTCFNRLATHFSISMFGHHTMFDGVWSPNISRLGRLFACYSIVISRNPWNGWNVNVKCNLRSDVFFWEGVIARYVKCNTIVPRGFTT